MPEVPLAPRTSVRVGGAGRFLVKPRDPQALSETLRVLSANGVTWMVLGGGANTIVGDGGIEGAVIRIGQDFCNEEVEEAGDHVVLTLGAGAPPPALFFPGPEARGGGGAPGAA